MRVDTLTQKKMQTHKRKMQRRHRRCKRAKTAVMVVWGTMKGERQIKNHKQKRVLITTDENS